MLEKIKNLSIVRKIQLIALSVSFIAFYIEEIDYSYVLEKRIASKHVATQEQLHIVNLDSIDRFGELQCQHLVKNPTDPMMSFTIFSI